MTEVADVPLPEVPRAERRRPTPLESLQAGARRVTKRSFERFAKAGSAGGHDWADEARRMYGLVGEHRFITNTLANQIGQVRFYVGRLSDDPLGEPEPLQDPYDGIPDEEVTSAKAQEDADEPLTPDDEAAIAAWDSFGGTVVNRQQMITRCAVNLLVPGEGYYVATPPPVEEKLRGREQTSPEGIIPGPAPAMQRPTELDLTTLTWRFLSRWEVTFNGSGDEVTLKIADSDTGSWTGSPDDVLLFRCWRPDPFEWWQADSPTKAALPILRKIVGLGEAADAQLDSRLSGAGVFLVPQSADDALRAQLGPERGGDEAESPFMAAMMDAFEASIQDRDSAARTVPIAFTVPDETVEKFKHIKFSTDLDQQYGPMEEAQIGRLALSFDAPKELLLGVASMNHWGAWLVKEDTVDAHIRPPAAIMADAFTTQYLWPVLEAGGMDEEVAHDYVIWYSVDHLIVRPNRFDDALKVYGAGALSDAALRRSGGFDDEDAPEGTPDEAFAMVLELVHRAPALAVSPGIPALVEQIRAVMAGQEPTPGNPIQQQAADSPDGVPPQKPAPATPGGPPAAASEPPPAVAASGAHEPNWCGNKLAHGPHTWDESLDSYETCPGINVVELMGSPL